MGFLEVLTIVFIALKLMGYISWSWFFVLLPEIVAFVIYVLWFGFVGTLLASNFRKR